MTDTVPNFLYDYNLIFIITLEINIIFIAILQIYKVKAQGWDSHKLASHGPQVSLNQRPS